MNMFDKIRDNRKAMRSRFLLVAHDLSEELMIQALPEGQLEEGQWYYGIGRLGPVAIWTNGVFKSLDFSLGSWGIGGDMEYGPRGFSPVAAIPAIFEEEVHHA